MSATPVPGERAQIRRPLSWILVGALCVSALTAIAAILRNDFDDADWRVIGTSTAFAIYSAVGASGASLRLRASEHLRVLGLATLALAAAGFVLFVPALWIDEDHETLWRWWGIATLGAFACSHAALMAGSFRDTDSGAVRFLGVASIALASLDAGLGILAIAGAFDDVDESAARFLAVLVVLMLLATALTPIVRRLQGAQSQPRAQPERVASAPPAPLAAEVIAAADRIETLNADPGNRAPEIRREVERLRELARSYSR